jgi:hypothetical protein
MNLLVLRQALVPPNQNAIAIDLGDSAKRSSYSTARYALHSITLLKICLPYFHGNLLLLIVLPI